MESFDYSSNGMYFITLCTTQHKQILSQVVGTGVPDGPRIYLSEYGVVADNQIKIMSDFYDDLKVLKYVIMPNHIHLLLQVCNDNGPSGMPVHTDNRNSVVSKFIGTFKRFCNKQYGQNIWQSRSFDRVIRTEEEYKKIWNYIESNPSKWSEDKYNNGPSGMPVPTEKGDNNG